MSLTKKKGWRKLTSWLITIVFLFTLLPGPSIMAADYDNTRFKDIVVNIDDDMLTALGIASANDINTALRQYLLSQGFNLEQLRVRSDVHNIDTTDLTSWYVYDHYQHAATPGAYAANDPIFDPVDANGIPFRPYFAYNESCRSGDVAILDGTDPSTYAPTSGNNYVRKFKNHIDSYKDDQNISNMVFVGYGGAPTSPAPAYSSDGFVDFTDFLFYPADTPANKLISFDIDSSIVNTHTMLGAGFLLNTGLYKEGIDILMNGYLLYIFFKPSGVNTWNTSTNRTATLNLYKIEGVKASDLAGYTKLHSYGTATNLQVNHEGGAHYNKPFITEMSGVTLVATATNVTKGDNDQLFHGSNGTFINKMHLQVAFTDTSLTVNIDDANDETDQARLVTWDNEISEENPIGAKAPDGTSFYGFGPLVDSGGRQLGHRCEQCSVYKFLNLKMGFLVSSVFEPILTGDNSSFMSGNNWDRFYVNLVNNAVSNGNDGSTPPSDYWDGIDDLRGDKAFYITQNVNNTVVESDPNNTIGADNGTNGLSGNGIGDSGWPKYDSEGKISGYWDPSNISPGDKGQALQDLVKYFGDYILKTTTNDWQEPTNPSQSANPRVDVDLVGTYVNTGDPISSLSGLDTQMFANNPVKVSIKNNFDNQDANDPYVLNGGQLTKLEVEWFYKFPSNPNLQIPLTDSPFKMSTNKETINIDLINSVGIYDLQNLSFDSSVIPNVATWPDGEYIAAITAYGNETPDPVASATVYKSITLKQDTLLPTAVLNKTASPGVTEPPDIDSLKGSTVYRGLSAAVDLSDDTAGNIAWGAYRYKIGLGPSDISLNYTSTSPKDGTPSGAIAWDTDLGTNGLVELPYPVIQPAHRVNVDFTKNTYDGLTSKKSLYVYVWDWVGNASLVEIPIAVNRISFSADTSLGTISGSIEPSINPFAGTYFRDGEKIFPMPTPPSVTINDGARSLIGYNTYKDAPTPLTSLTISGDMVLYPVFEDPEASFTVSFNTNGGTAVSSLIISSGGLVSTPPTTTKSGYIFDGWYADPELVIPFDFTSPIYGNTTLYAKWLQNDTPTSKHNPVIYLINVVNTAIVDVPIKLAGTVNPTATNKDIEWQIIDQGTTGAVLSGEPKDIFTASATGTAIVEARVVNGTDINKDYTRLCYITVTINPVTDIIDLTQNINANSYQTLTGTVIPAGATNQTIKWSLISNGGTGSTLSNGVLSTGAYNGKIIVKAVIDEGALDANGNIVNYEKTFEINIENGLPQPTFVEVDSITGIPENLNANSTLTLNGIVSPGNATNNIINWSLENNGGTGSTLSGDVLTAGPYNGKIKVKATIIDGKKVDGQLVDYEETFEIDIVNGSTRPTFVPVTSIAGIPQNIDANQLITLSGSVNPSNATNNSIDWSLIEDDGTESAISGNLLITGPYNGKIKVKATIIDGKEINGQLVDYEETFEIEIVNGSTKPVFVAVSGITGLPSAGIEKKPISLTDAVVTPNNATNQSIIWEITDPGTTGASISSNGMLNTTAPGTVTLTATVKGGLGQDKDYTSGPFTVTIVPESRYTLTVVANAGGIISMISPYQSDYVYDDSITVTASPNTGYQFTGWAADGLIIDNPSSNQIAFAMPANSIFLTANFTKVPPTITGITIAPNTTPPIQVVAGSDQQFVATVQGTNNPPQNGVVWSVVDNVYGSTVDASIDSNGKLTVGANQTSSLTVTATVTDPVSGTYSASSIVDIIAAGAIPNPVNDFTLDVPSSGYEFPPLDSDYTDVPSVNVNAANTGNQLISSLTPSTSGTPGLAGGSAFDITPATIGNLAPGESGSFTITPKTDLPPGTYTETITVTDSQGNTKSFDLSVTVNPPAGSGTSGSGGGNYATPGNQADQEITKGKVEIETHNPLNAVPQAAAGTQAKAETAALAQINDLLKAAGLSDVTAVITPNSGVFNPAVAGNADNPNGTNGSFAFTVTLSSPDGADQTTATIVLPIIASILTDLAKNAIESKNPLNAVTQTVAYSQAASETEALKQINALLQAAGLNGITPIITPGSGVFTPASAGTSANANGTDGSYTFTVTIASPGGTAQTTTTITLPITATKYSPGGSNTGGSGSSGTSKYTDTTVTEENPDGTEEPGTSDTTADLPYSDVNKGDWFYNDVLWAYQNGYMDGVGDGKFGPRISTERSMIVTVFYRLENSPTVSGISKFKDVLPGAYYTDAVIWAEANGIAQGYTDGNFKPNQTVSRQELAAFFERYAAFKDYDTTIRGDLSKFKDQPAQWAKENVSWAVGTALMQGKGENTLDPKGTAIRAEFAAMLYRFVQNNQQN